MRDEYSGGPPSVRERIDRWLAPRGGSVTDGLRLAAINGAGLVAALVVLAIVSLVTRLLDRVLPIPLLVTGFFTVLLLVGAALYFWYRYASAHGRAARLRNRGIRPDVFGAIAAVPFVLVALVLLSLGLLGLLLAVISFSLDRAVEAARDLAFALLFVALALANVIVARAASD